MSESTLTEAHIRQLASSGSFERGFQYYRRQAVANVVQRGHMITAQVAGSDYEPYQVQITLGDTGIEKTLCSCPYDWGGICKHIVATLLVLIHDGQKIDVRPELASLLADLTADQLRQILLGVAAKGRAFAETVEKEVDWLKTMPAMSAGPSNAAIEVDISAACREIRKDFRLVGHGDPLEYGYYDEYAALEMDPELMLGPHLDKVTALLDGGNVAQAQHLITAIIDTFRDELADLDDYILEFNEDVIGEAGLLLGAALAEVLLSQDLSPAEQTEWLGQIAVWDKGLNHMAIAKTALEQGWTFPPLVAAMQGDISTKGAWDGDAPYYADELALARLRILARQNRQQEYIHLAEAEGQTQLSIMMLATSGQTDKAVAEAKQWLKYPSALLAVAQALAEQGAIAAALEVAAHGLSLQQETGKLALARWARQTALSVRNEALALSAAQAAFAAGMMLVDYTAVQQIAGDQWLALKPTLLRQLQNSQQISDKIDIYLHENMLTQAMIVVDKNSSFVSEPDLRRVAEATRATAPDWGIRKFQRRAEEIMDGGWSRSYDTAAAWLKDARDIYQLHNRLPEWYKYLDGVLETHHRKYKLVPMLRKIR